MSTDPLLSGRRYGTAAPRAPDGGPIPLQALRSPRVRLALAAVAACSRRRAAGTTTMREDLGRATADRAVPRGRSPGCGGGGGRLGVGALDDTSQVHCGSTLPPGDGWANQSRSDATLIALAVGGGGSGRVDPGHTVTVLRRGTQAGAVGPVAGGGGPVGPMSTAGVWVASVESSTVTGIDATPPGGARARAGTERSDPCDGRSAARCGCQQRAHVTTSRPHRTGGGAPCAGGTGPIASNWSRRAVLPLRRGHDLAVDTISGAPIGRTPPGVADHRWRSPTAWRRLGLSHEGRRSPESTLCPGPPSPRLLEGVPGT